MTDEPADRASAVASPVVAAIRSRVPDFDAAFLRALDDEEGEMGAFQAMSVLAEWVEDRIQHSPQSLDALPAFAAVEEIASSSEYPMGRALVTEFVEALGDSPRAIALMGAETLRYR
jgi:hypothetical protein